MILTARPRGVLAIVPWFDQSACSFVPTWHCSGGRDSPLPAPTAPPSSAGPEPRAAPASGRAWRGPTICHGSGAAPPCGQDVVAHHSVTAIASGRLNRGDGVQIEIDDVLKC